MGIKYCVSTHMGDLVINGGGNYSCAGIKIIHDKYQLLLGVKHSEHSAQFHRGCSFSRQKAGLTKA